MHKKWSVLVGLVLVAAISFAEEGRWTLSTDKKTGKDVALLQTWSKRVMKVIPLEHVRDYSPVPNDDVVDKKQLKRALRRGLKFTRLTAKNSSATPINGGRLLIFQEQTIVMPPQLEGQSENPLETKEQDRQEPDDNSVLVTLFDDSGTVLWSRKYGPLAGRLPVDRKAWTFPNTADLEGLEVRPEDLKKK